MCTNPIVFSRHGQFLIACLDLGDLLLCWLKRFRRWNLLALGFRWRFRFWLRRFNLLPRRFAAFTLTEFFRTRFAGRSRSRTSRRATCHWRARTRCFGIRKTHTTTYAVGSRAPIIVVAIPARASISSLTRIATASFFAIPTRTAVPASFFISPIIAWRGGGRQLRTYRLIRLAYLDVILRVKPMACSA